MTNIFQKKFQKEKKGNLYFDSIFQKQERSLNESIKSTTILQTDFSSGSEQDRVDLSQQVNISLIVKSNPDLGVHGTWILTDPSICV